MKVTIEYLGADWVYEVSDSLYEDLLNLITEDTDGLEVVAELESLEDVCRDTGLDYEEVKLRLSHLNLDYENRDN